MVLADFPFIRNSGGGELARTATLEITITIRVSKMCREGNAKIEDAIRTMDSVSFLGIGSWTQGVQIFATDGCEIMLPTPALSAWTALGRENTWYWFSAYSDPWSPLRVHHLSNHD
ncbi:hypothetical protein F5144DRAFT_545365 [Chaetomium tenue]|uniref:Uncharacterized protein n=1 Tax=Chaetomium tenue TaxID=1854479 RepID=A0ACB7PJR0_9PEZI|nr:hypothetical protein F5144DRAFT_545365 [Chaetomium globosum]